MYNRKTVFVAVLVTALAFSSGIGTVVAQDSNNTSGANIGNIQSSLSDTNGDGLQDQVEVDVTVSNVESGNTTITLGESNFDVDVLPTDTTDGNQAQFVTPYDTDGDGVNEKVQFVEVGTANATYTVVADLSNQADGDTGSIDTVLGSGVTSSTVYTVENTTGSIRPGNPFGNQNNQPANRKKVVQRIVEWNTNDGVVGGKQYSRQEIVQSIVEWNTAKAQA